MLNLSNMSVYSSTITSVSGVPASVRDKLLTVNGGYSMGEDVQIHSDYIFDSSLDDIIFTDEERLFFKELIRDFDETETFIFCP